MDATPHLVAGAALTGRMAPPIAFVVGLASHLVLDAVPHYHYAWITGLTWKALADLGVGIVLAGVVVLMAPRRGGAIAGALGAGFPEISRAYWPQEGGLGDLLARLPHHEVTRPWGLMSQFAVVVIALMWAVWVRRRASGTVVER